MPASSRRFRCYCRPPVMVPIVQVLVTSFLPLVLAQACGDQKSEPFLVVHDSNCKDPRSVQEVLIAHGVSQAEFEAFEKVLRENRVIRHQRSLWSRVPALRRRLAAGPHDEDPLPSLPELLQSNLSGLPLKLRRDVGITLLDLKVHKEKNDKAASLGSANILEVASEPKAVVADMYLEFLEEDVVHSSQLEGDRVLEIAAECIPCQLLPAGRPPRMYTQDDSFSSQNNTTPRRLADGGAHVPNEAHFNGMWWIGGPPGGLNYLEALKCSRGGSYRPVVAVIDTGCSMHPDLEPAFCGPEESCRGFDYSNFRNPDNNPHDEPVNDRHGTTVSGYIGATPNNNYGIAGVCPHCRISCFKVSDGNGLSGNAIHKSIDHIIGAKVVKVTNHSYQGGWSDYEKRAFEKMGDAGILNVVSAGNNPCDSDQPANTNAPNACRNRKNSHYNTGFRPGPSGYWLDNMLVVGANNNRGTRASFSTWGAKTVHVFAPGDDVAGLENKQARGWGGTPTFDGTSFSGPITAGLAGYLWSFNPALTYKDVKKLIVENVRPVASLQGYCQSGGLADAALALRALGVRCKNEACPSVRTPTQDQTSDFYRQRMIKEIKRINEGAPLPTDPTPTVPPRKPKPTAPPRLPGPTQRPGRPRPAPPSLPPRRKTPPPRDGDDGNTFGEEAYYESLRRDFNRKSAAPSFGDSVPHVLLIVSLLFMAHSNA